MDEFVAPAPMRYLVDVTEKPGIRQIRVGDRFEWHDHVNDESAILRVTAVEDGGLTLEPISP